MIIETRVETPVNLTRAQKEHIKNFAAEGDASWSPESSKFFSKIQELWDGLND